MRNRIQTGATLIAGVALLLASCAPSRFVKPLKAKEQAASFSFGGPLIAFAGMSIPMPFSTLAYGYGLNDKVTAYGSLHTTSLLFGNIQSDLGATIKLFEKEKFGISASPALQIATSLNHGKSFRVWPSAEANVYYSPGSKPSYLYAGAASWFELAASRANGEVQPRHYIPQVQLGYTIVKTKLQHQFELRYLGLGIPNLPNVVEYKGIGGKGAVGIYYSINRKF